MLEIIAFRTILLVALGVSVVIGLVAWFATNGLEGTSRPAGLVMAIGVPGVGVLLALLLTLLIVKPWYYTRDIADMLAGKAWAHWRYDEAEWRAGNRVEGRRNRGNQYTAGVFVLLLGATMLLCGLGLDDPQARNEMMLAGAASVGVAVVILLVILSMNAHTRARRSPAGDVYISPLGIYRRPGGYTILHGYGTRVHNIELVDGPPAVVQFDVRVQQRGLTDGPLVHRYTIQREQATDVLVPAGCEDEARTLLERFRDEIL
ncbi:hypothetical protein [Dactylosporangium salmoneum]|uniref:PH domain-containing protein n=1 Tax=Dactylosporangium salmoneum TaxID=53361 RepID=A0ABN3GSV8_9ACTN